MILFFLFVIVPLIEIGLFITVGGEIGLLKTLVLCVLTAMIGAVLVRAQGLATIFSARTSLASGKLPVSELFTGLCLGIAGALLMTPGFFTDAIGFSLLVPKVRDWLRHYAAERFKLETGGQKNTYRSETRDPNVIDVEYEMLDPEDRP